ncbi:MAG: alpha/beta fold hydrolase [Lachnospirales bacterium]
MSAGVIKSGSANIYYEITDNIDKEILVLLHGNGQSMESFRDIINILKADFRILSIDSRGHGKSEFGRAELSLGAMANDLETIFIELGIKKASILGFGDGANVAMIFAMKCSDMVNRLILFSANYNFSGYNITSKIFLGIGYLCSVMGAKFDMAQRLNKEYYALIVKEPRLKKESLKAILCKTLVVCPKNDIIKKSHTKTIANTIPNCSIINVDGDRFWLFRKSEKACKLICEFLKSC